MDVLLIGSGGREHAIAWKLAQSKNLGKLYIAPGNAGTERCGENVAIAATDIKKIVDFAKQNDIGLVVVGPEDPLAAGLVDALQKASIMAFGPSADAAQLEADKAFAKQLMRASAISTAEGRIFDRFSDAKRYIASRDEPVVIKAAGLAQGKGVIVCDDPADGILAAEKIMCDRMFGSAGDKIIVEDKLLGEEASILAFVDGHNIYVMESSQDHKPIGDGDTGPNTGGMGAYSPAPVVTEEMMDKITREILVPVVDGMNRNGTPYKGVLYAGLIITSAGPRVLEFNVRFGDPETQPILMRLKSDLLEVCLAVCQGRLDEVTLQWDKRPAVCVVMASGGYPGDYEKGKLITGLDEAEQLEDVVVFHAGTKNQDGDIVTNGGRVLGVTALGEQIADAKARAYEAVDKIKFDGANFRHDIADKAIKKPPKAGISNLKTCPECSRRIENRKSKIENGGKVLTRLLFAGLILAVVFGLIFIWLVRALPHVAVAEISELTNAKIDVESVDLAFDGSVLIKRLVIRPDHTRQEGRGIPASAGTAPAEAGGRQGDENVILKADTVYARFSLGSLLLLGPRLKEIRISDFVFNAQYDLDTEKWNIAALKIKVPKNGTGGLPAVQLEKGVLQYSKVSKGQAEVLAAVPIDMRFRPAEQILGGYSFDITTAQRADSGRSRLFGSWRPGRLTIAGGISSAGIPVFTSPEAGTLQKAWVINLLDAELSYDRDNNYSLKLKIKDLLYSPSTPLRVVSLSNHRGNTGETSVFNRPALLAKSGLFTAWQRFFSRYRPAGRVDMDLEASGNFKSAMAPSEGTLAGKIYCKDVSICDRKFPYVIEQITGQVDFTENSVILNNLDGKHGGVKVTFNGWVKDFGLHPPQAGKNQQYQIQIASDNMALDKDLYDALNAKQKEWWSAFSPTGLAAIDYRLSQQAQTDKKKTLTVELHGAEATYRDFSYPLKNLTGKLSFDRDSITVADVVSQTNGGTITFNGKVTECGTSRPIYYLAIKANDVSFDSTLAKRLLAKQSDFYNRFDVAGLADAEVTIVTPIEGLEPTNFFADLALKKTSVQVNKSAAPLAKSQIANRKSQIDKPLVISDVSAKVTVTANSTSIKNFTGRYGQSLICLVGGIWQESQPSAGRGHQPFRYYLTLTAEQLQLSDDLIGFLPTPIGKMISHLSPEGKINLSAYLNKAADKDQPDYQITVNCLGDSVNFKRFAYPLRDVTGTLIITNNKVALDNLTAAPADSAKGAVAGSTIKLNGQITLADSAFNEGSFALSASDIFFSESLRDALPKGVASFYQALSPAGRFDLDLDNIKIFTDDGKSYIDFAGAAKFKACRFNISGTPVELERAIANFRFSIFDLQSAFGNRKSQIDDSGGFTDGQVSLTAENLVIYGKSITNLTADINYIPSASGGQSWEALNLLADCYGGRLIGTLELSPASGQYLLQVGFDNIDLRRFLADTPLAPGPLDNSCFRRNDVTPAKAGVGAGSVPGGFSPRLSAGVPRPVAGANMPTGGRPPTESGDTSGIMSGSLSLGAAVADNSSRIGRCRLAIKDMQVGKLSPLAKLLYVLKLKEQKDFAFGQMVVDSYIKGNRLFFEKFDLSGQALAFNGSGWMDLQSESVNLTLTARGERLAAAEPSILQSLTEGLGGAVVRVEVTGNVHDPKVETRTLPVVEDSLKILGKPR